MPETEAPNGNESRGEELGYGETEADPNADYVYYFDGEDGCDYCVRHDRFLSGSAPQAARALQLLDRALPRRGPPAGRGRKAPLPSTFAAPEKRAIAPSSPPPSAPDPTTGTMQSVGVHLAVRPRSAMRACKTTAETRPSRSPTTTASGPPGRSARACRSTSTTRSATS